MKQNNSVLTTCFGAYIGVARESQKTFCRGDVFGDYLTQQTATKRFQAPGIGRFQFSAGLYFFKIRFPHFCVHLNRFPVDTSSCVTREEVENGVTTTVANLAYQTVGYGLSPICGKRFPSGAIGMVKSKR